MSRLLPIITAAEPARRDQSLHQACQGLALADLLAECDALESFRHQASLYEQVRALVFLYALCRFYIPCRPELPAGGAIPYRGYTLLLERRYEEAIRVFLQAQHAGPTDSLGSALATAYRGLAFQTLTAQVRRSVRSLRGNHWMFRTGHPADFSLRIVPELLTPRDGLYPVLHERTPVRMDLSHCGCSDIFFLGMDYPEGARVLNISVDLSVHEPDSPGTTAPQPPVEAYLRVIDAPELRLVSVDLETVARITRLTEVFDFARDNLGLLKAAAIAAGLVPPGLEGSGQSLGAVLEQLVGPGRGLELVSQVNRIPRGSRLAVSTSLLASLIAVCMRATRQVASFTGGLSEADRRLIAARAILGEWLGGSGGGWQDSGGIWPGIKLIQGALAQAGDPEFGASRGQLLPHHTVLSTDIVPAAARQALQDSLVLVHGGMAQNVGPVLEMVTERYLLRSSPEWEARQELLRLFDQLIEHLRAGDMRAIGRRTEQSFQGPMRTIVPWSSNLYTETLIERVRARFGTDFWGFWMLGGIAGGGMGFLFAPAARHSARDSMAHLMQTTKQELEAATPFGMEPVVYDFAINERGSWAERREPALMPRGYYALVVPEMIRAPAASLSPAWRVELHAFAQACRNDPSLTDMVPELFDRLLPGSPEVDAAGECLDELLAQYGFDRVAHEQVRADLRSGRIGLAQNRLPVNSRIQDVRPGDVFDAVPWFADDPAKTGHAATRRTTVPGSTRSTVTGTGPGTVPPDALRTAGLEALRTGQVAVVTLAGGTGSRWTQGAGVVKAINPFCRLGGRFRSFVEVHLAKSRRTSRLCGAPIPHIITSSYLTDQPLQRYLERHDNCGYAGPLYLSPGSHVGLRLVPTARDLRFAWDAVPRQRLDPRAQKLRDDQQRARIEWARQNGEANDYTDNLPRQCLHAVGHWYEVPNLLVNGVLARVLQNHPRLRYLMVHNIDTVGADLDPILLGHHAGSGAGLTFEVTSRRLEDRGGGLARVDGDLRLVEGLALPREEVEFTLTYYNSSTTWVSVDALLTAFGLTRDDLSDRSRATHAVREMAARMPTYVTLKEVKKRWGRGQEDIHPVTQFEKLWGDISTLPELDCRYVCVPRRRGQQLKDVAQLDGWLRDGSAAYVEQLCAWQ